jgi:hypothetical protein
MEKDETEELIKIFVASIKTAVRQAHGPERSRRAEKKPRLGVVKCSVLDVCFTFNVGRSMFDPPEADKCLLAFGEFDVHLLKQLRTV